MLRPCRGHRTSDASEPGLIASHGVVPGGEPGRLGASAFVPPKWPFAQTAHIVRDMTQWPDFETEDRRLSLKMRLWLGVVAAVLGVLTLVLGLVQYSSVNLFSVIGIVIGIPMALIAWRKLHPTKVSGS